LVVDSGSICVALNTCKKKKKRKWIAIGGTIKNAKYEVCSLKEPFFILGIDSAFKQNVPSIKDFALRWFIKKVNKFNKVFCSNTIK
jgi:hypothetical protein